MLSYVSTTTIDMVGESPEIPKWCSLLIYMCVCKCVFARGTPDLHGADWTRATCTLGMFNLAVDNSETTPALALLAILVVI